MSSADTPVVELRGLGRSFSGSTEVHALIDVDLTISPGEWVSIQGPSGAGKSTLLSLLGLLDQPTSGQILLAGLDATRLSDRHRSRLRSMQIGFVFQAFHLLPHLTALENVMLPMAYNGRFSRKQQARRASDLLDSVGLSHRRSALPSTLSGGERQRVAMARSLSADPALLLCDEPTGNLDSKTSEEIVDLLRTVNGTGVTLIVVTHSPAVAAAGSRQLMLIDGRMRELASS